MTIQMRLPKAARPAATGALAVALLTFAGCTHSARHAHMHSASSPVAHDHHHHDRAHSAFPSLVLAGPVIGDPAGAGWEHDRNDARMGYDKRVPQSRVEVFERYSRDRVSTFGGRVRESSTTHTRTYIRQRYE